MGRAVIVLSVVGLTGSAGCGRLHFDAVATADSDQPTDVQTFPSTVVYQNTQTATVEDQSAADVAITAMSGDLLIAVVATKPDVAIVDFTGLTAWSNVVDQCGEDRQTRISTFFATPAAAVSGLVSATFAVQVQTANIAISTYRNANATAPLGASITFNHEGLGGGCGVGTETATYEQTLAAFEGGIVFAATAVKNGSHTFGAGQTERFSIVTVDVADGVSLYGADTGVGSTNDATVSGTMGPGDVEWAGVAIAIRP